MRTYLGKLWVQNTVSFALLLLALMVLMSARVDAATPKKESIINGTEITLGDVFEDVDENADHVLAPAPAAGRTMVLDARSLNRIARAFGFDWRAQSPFDKTVVRRAVTVVKGDAVLTEIENALAGANTPEHFEIELYNRSFSLVLPGNVTPQINISALGYSPADETFDATVEVLSPNNESLRTLHVAGRLHRLVEVPVPVARLRNGDVIAAADLELIKMRSSHLAPEVVTDLDRIVGQTPRRGLMEGKPVRMNDVVSPQIVSKGEFITMVLQNSSLNLLAQGKALEGGATGDVVRVMNTASNQVIDAKITGPGQVAVQPPTVHLID